MSIQRFARVHGVVVVSALALAAAAFTRSDDARACGCTSPMVPTPAPTPTAAGYAVNQRGEQIIFEVEPGFVTAHVLIQYAGRPDKFAWIVPVPSVPELSLSHETTFGLLDSLTAPKITIANVSSCPSQLWECRYHPPPPACPSHGGASTGKGGGNGTGGGYGSAGAGGSGAGMTPGGVEVISKQVIGSYDTVTFSAGDAASAVTWLNQNGFIVNDTMSPFMQPYVDEKMLFVASKLVPGAGVDAIKPLKMRYAADAPMIPIRLTAVAAEPHMPITAFVFGSSAFGPKDHPLLKVAPKDLDFGPDGRANYPMLLSRMIDETGGDGFFVEYSATAPPPAYETAPCCLNPYQNGCYGLSSDGKCECPNNPVDAVDCGNVPDLIAGTKLYDALRAKYPRVTRLTTRLSPEQMTFDPTFVPSQEVMSGGLVLGGSHHTLTDCPSDVIDKAAYEAVIEGEACANVYCGHGVCVRTVSAPAACACDTGYVARKFFDLDGKPSITCVRDKGTVDLAAGGLALPSACFGVLCGEGSCVDVGGFPTCRCAPGTGAALTLDAAPSCAPITSSTGSPGGENRSAGIAPLKVCVPRPPSCGGKGWLVPAPEYGVHIKGENCLSSQPDPADLIEPPYPPPNVCPDDGSGGKASGGSGGKGGAPGSGHGASGAGATSAPGGHDGAGAPAMADDTPPAEASGGCSVGTAPVGGAAQGLLLLVAAGAVAGLGARRRREQPRD